MRLLYVALLWVLALPADEAAFFDSLAERAFAAGDYEAATEAYLQVAEIAPSPAALFDVARSAERAGRGSVAYSYYAEYLRTDDDDVGRRRAAERALAGLRARLALVVVRSEPADARIWVDRRELGSFGQTPRTLVLEPGRHRLEIEREGFVVAERQVEARAGASATVELALAPLEGTLVVRAEPARATVRVMRGEDEVAEGRSGERLTLPVGRYQVEVRAEGHLPQTATVRVSDGREETVRITAPPRPPPVGRILVSAPERGAEVFVDGERRATIPATIPGITAGAHVVEVHLTGRAPVRREVTVEPDRAVLVRIRREDR